MYTVVERTEGSFNNAEAHASVSSAIYPRLHTNSFLVLAPPGMSHFFPSKALNDVKTVALAVGVGVAPESQFNEASDLKYTV